MFLDGRQAFLYNEFILMHSNEGDRADEHSIETADRGFF